MKNMLPVVVVSCVLLLIAPLPAQEARDDARNTVLSSRTHYKMPVFATRDAWEQRAAFLRKQILASAGLLITL